MASGYMRVVVPLVFLLLASTVVAGTEAAVSCGTVIGTFFECFPLFPSGEPEPDTCFNALMTMKELASDSQAVCGCIKSLLVLYSSDYLKIISAYLGKSGVNLPFKLDHSVDCNSLK